jgi:hypothetical protein
MIIINLPSLAKAINDEKLLVGQLEKTCAMERQSGIGQSLPPPTSYQTAKN